MDNEVMATDRVAAKKLESAQSGTVAANNGGMNRAGVIKSTVLAGALAILTAACGPEFTAGPGGNDAGGDAHGGNGGMAGSEGGTSAGGMISTGGTGGVGGNPDGGGAGGCNPNDPDSITVVSDDECFKGVQFDVGGANIVQEGSTPDSVACQTTPYCMRNLQPGGYGFLTVKNTVNGSITLRHTAAIKNPGLYALCVNDYPAPPAPTQEDMREKFMSGGFVQLAANPASNPVTLEFLCPQGDWVAYRIDIQP